MEEQKKKSKEDRLKDLKRQQRQRTRNTKIEALEPKDDQKKTKLVPGETYMVGADVAKVLVKAGRAKIIK